MKRQYKFDRVTKETSIKGEMLLDGSGKAKVDTGIGFLDHMLELFSFHSSIDLDIQCKGDLHVCPHHTIEDIAITIGNALDKILDARKGINRYGLFYLPMDEVLSRTVIDFSGRPYHVFKGEFKSEKIGELPTEMIKHFFYSIAACCKMTLHQEVFYGENDHHIAESLFKGFARSLKDAIEIKSDIIPSSKGVL